MLKTKATIEKLLNDRVYHLVCDADAPITDAKAVLDYFKDYLEQIEEAATKHAAAQMDQQQQEPKPDEQQSNS